MPRASARLGSTSCQVRHRCYRRALRREPVLVLPDLCPECRRHRQLDRGRLGHVGLRRQPGRHDAFALPAHDELGFVRGLCVAGGQGRSRCPPVDVRLVHKAPRVGHADLEALAGFGGRRQRQLVDVGLRGRRQGYPRVGHGFAVRVVRRHGAINLQHVGHALPVLLPAKGRGRRHVRQRLRLHVLVLGRLGRHRQRHALQPLRPPRAHLGRVFGPFFHRGFLVRLRIGRQHAAVVHRLVDGGLFVPLCADGGRHQLRLHPLRPPAAHGPCHLYRWRRGFLELGPPRHVHLPAYQ
mmetsp:Transcript_78900/g.228058  ORF Transcript_78900/g.228058 Transcript_78900/m.228058 type:complete len:295 (-) Transcript_78900:560-1444(-)